MALCENLPAPILPLPQVADDLPSRQWFFTVDAPSSPCVEKQFLLETFRNAPSIVYACWKPPPSDRPPSSLCGYIEFVNCVTRLFCVGLLPDASFERGQCSREEVVERIVPTVSYWAAPPPPSETMPLRPASPSPVSGWSLGRKRPPRDLCRYCADHPTFWKPPRLSNKHSTPRDVQLPRGLTDG